MLFLLCRVRIHVMGEVLTWVKKEGGVEEMERRSVEKSKLLYAIIDESNGFYSNPVDPSSRLVTIHQFVLLLSMLFSVASTRWETLLTNVTFFLNIIRMYKLQ